MWAQNDYNLTNYPLSVGCGPNGKEENKNDYEVKIKKAPDFYKRTLYPMTTTSSVLAIKFNDGVAIATDVTGDYGKMIRFKQLDKLFKVNDNIVIATSGDYADFQYLKDKIEQRSISERILEDGYQMKAINLYTWLTRVMYSRRSKFDPLWNNVIVAGFNNGQSFLGVIDKLGMAFEDACIATGMGSYFALPVLRSAVERQGGSAGIDKATAHQLLAKCIEILYYRDCSGAPIYQIASVTADGVEILPPTEVESNWDMAAMIEGLE